MKWKNQNHEPVSSRFNGSIVNSWRYLVHAMISKPFAICKDLWCRYYNPDNTQLLLLVKVPPVSFLSVSVFKIQYSLLCHPIWCHVFGERNKRHSSITLTFSIPVGIRIAIHQYYGHWAQVNQKNEHVSLHVANSNDFPCIGNFSDGVFIVATQQTYRMFYGVYRAFISNTEPQYSG